VQFHELQLNREGRPPLSVLPGSSASSSAVSVHSSCTSESFRSSATATSTKVRTGDYTDGRAGRELPSAYGLKFQLRAHWAKLQLGQIAHAHEGLAVGAAPPAKVECAVLQ